MRRVRVTSVAVGLLALLALMAWPSAQSAIGNFKRLVLSPVDARTIASNSLGTPATLTLTPTGSYVTLTCQDIDGCTITMGETGIPDGMPVTISVPVAALTYPNTFDNQAGVLELDGPVTLAPGDLLSLMYAGDRWVETGRKNAYGPREVVKSIHQTDAQIKAWPTTNSTPGKIEIVPASSGFAQVPLWAFFVCDSTNGNYGNINGSAFIIVYTNDSAGFGTADFHEAAGIGTNAKVSQLLARSGTAQGLLPMYGVIDTAMSGGTSSDLMGATITPASGYSGNIVLYVDNNGAGNFTGGSGSNAGCDITVGYLRIKIPGL